MVVARGWLEGNLVSYCLLHTEFQFYRMKGVLEMHGGNGCTTI